MLVVIGPSASGKTQIVKILIEQYNMKKLVTYTSRPMRQGEVEGRDYHFIDVDEFKKRIQEDFFLEYVNYNGNYYGTSHSDLTKDKVVILEKQGLMHYVNVARDTVKIVFLVCSKPILRIRMQNRGDSIEAITKRLNGDDDVFNDEIAKLADWIIDTSCSNIYKDAKTIYQLYQNSLKEE